MAKIGCAKCGGTKKMALGGSAVKKAPVQLYGIPQQNMGTSSQMGFGKKGGTLNTMARGGSSKASTASKAAQAASRRVLAAKALAAKKAGVNQANAGKIALKNPVKSNLPAVKSNLPAVKGNTGVVKIPAKGNTSLTKIPAKGNTGVVKSSGVTTIIPSTAASKKNKVSYKGVEDAIKPRSRGGVSKGYAPGVGAKKSKKISMADLNAKVAEKKVITKRVTAVERSGKAAPGAAQKHIKYKESNILKGDKIRSGGKIPKMKLGKKALIGAGIAAGVAALGYGISKYKKVTDKPKTPVKPVTPKPVAKSSGSTKKYTSPNTGTTTIINTKPNGEKQTKVTTYGGQSSYKSTHVNPKGSPVLDKVKKAAEDVKGNKAGDGSSLKRPTNLKPTTKTDTNANGTKTTIYTDASGNRHVKVVKKDGTTFTSNDTPKAATTPKVETKKTTTTPKKTTPKVTAKVADEVTKMETKRPSTIETKNPADLKIIEPATKASKTSSTPSSSTSTTVPRANLINRVRGSINASRERRAERAETRGDKEKATKLRDREKATQAKMMKKGGSVKSKKK